MRLQMLQTLDTLQREHRIGKKVATFLQRALSDAALPLTRVQCERWLRALCRHEDGSDYAKSQRAIFVRELNLVLSEWHRSGLTREVFQVRNYRRERQYGLLNVEALQYVTVSHVDALKEQFLRDLNNPKAMRSREDRLQRAFHQFVFAAIAFGGMAWTGVFADLARLQWRHLRTAPQGYLLIPRFGMEQRIYIPSLVALCALLLGEHLPHPPKAREPELDQPILPRVRFNQEHDRNASAENEDDEETDAEDSPTLAPARAKFNAWLGNLSQRARLRDLNKRPFQISVQALAAVARAYVVEIYTPPVAGALLGFIPYSQVPAEQSGIFAEYRQPSSTVRVGETIHTAKPKISESVTSTPVLPDLSHEQDELAPILLRLHRALQPLFQETGHARKRTAQQLEELAEALLKEITFEGETAREKIANGYVQRLVHDSGTRRELAHFNVACLALWLAELCRHSKRDAKTVAARRSDAIQILRLFPERGLNELDAEDGYELVGMDRAESSRRRLIGTWHQLHSFMQQQLALPVVDVDWREFAIARTQCQVNLMGQTGFERLQQAFCERERNAQMEADAAKATDYRNGYLAANLAFYFGARLNETVHLTLGDLVIRSQQPYICIWHSKRGKSRIVYARHVPKEILEELKQERGRRYALNKDLAVPFLANQRGENADPKRISEIVVETLEELGSRGSADATAVVFHTLRHEYANRLMMLDVPLLDIANSMGHASPDTTTGSYLHCLDFLQREQLENCLRGNETHVGLSHQGLGAQLGIGRTAVLALIGRFEKATGTRVKYFERSESGEEPHATARVDRRHIADDDAVRLLAFRLGRVHSRQIR